MTSPAPRPSRAAAKKPAKKAPAKKAPPPAPPAPAADDAAQAAAAQAAAAEAADWRNRRTNESHLAGLAAARARQRLLQALDSGDDRMARAAAAAYSVLVDKAEALAPPPGQAQQEVTVVDALAARREARRAGASDSAAPGRRSQPRRSHGGHRTS